MSCAPSTSSMESSRKSRRLQVRRGEVDVDAPAVVDTLPTLYRGSIPPTGAHRVPFHQPNDKTAREQRKLMGTPWNGVLVQKEDKDNKVKVGEAHQALVEDFVMRPVPVDSDDEPDRDELVWKGPEETDEESGAEDQIRSVFWRAIWRLFGGQIRFEDALQHLMRNDFDMPRSLETVDECLRSSTQKFKPLAKVQMDKFEDCWKQERKATGLRHLQSTCMKNYHAGEIQTFYHEFKRLVEKPACNCEEPMVEDLDFQPRWSCSNCTKGLRENPLSPDLVCLLCKTYEKMTGNPRPAENVIWLDEETQKIKDWNLMERLGGRRISKEDFERIQMEETRERWMRQELTKEERDVVDFRVGKKIDAQIGEKLVRQLEPRPLPLFRKCQCGRGIEKKEEVRPAPEVVVGVLEKAKKRANKFDDDLQSVPVKRERKQKKNFDV